MKAKIARELYQAIKQLRGSGELLSIVGSYGDDDDDVLRLLQSWNARHEVPLAPTN
jgi:hypothetical protein